MQYRRHARLYALRPREPAIALSPCREPLAVRMAQGNESRRRIDSASMPVSVVPTADPARVGNQRDVPRSLSWVAS